MKKKNIILIMTDQHRHSALGVRTSYVKTPNLDKLANDGILYSKAVCNCPMCVPSRYSMMTGLYPFQTGVRHNTNMCVTNEQLEAPTIAQRLKNLGYTTGGFGKTHWYVGDSFKKEIEVHTDTRGFDVRAHIDTDRPATCEPNAKQWGRCDRVSYDTYKSESLPMGGGGEEMVGYLGITSKLDKYTCSEGWLTNEALDFLDTTTDDEPFFLYLSFDGPHPGFIVLEEFEKLYNIDDIPDYDESLPLDIINNSHASIIRPWIKDWVDASSKERRLGKLRYYAMCSMIDWQIGRVIKKLDDENKLNDTVIIFTADHGDMLGDRLAFSKYSLYDNAVRVPLIVWGKDIGGGKVDNRHAELVDILPTILDIAQEDIPIELPGGSLLREPCRKGSFSEMHGSGYEGMEKAQTLMWRKDDYKLIVHVNGDAANEIDHFENCQCELYDLAHDPMECNNIYDIKREVASQLVLELLIHITSKTAKWPSKPSSNSYI